MKRGFLLLFFFASWGEIIAQTKGPILKAFAYRRQSLPGASPQKAVQADGSLTKRAEREFYTYYIFVEHKKGQTIKPVILWINGKPNQVKTEKLIKTPVLLKREGIGEKILIDTLARKTKNGLIRIDPDGELTIEPLPLGKDNDQEVQRSIKLEYYWKGKKYSCTITEIKDLEPLVLQ